MATSDGWKTINGVHVFISNGAVVKGPQALIGRNASSADVKRAKQKRASANKTKERVRNLNEKIKNMSDSEIRSSSIRITSDLSKENYDRVMRIKREENSKKREEKRKASYDKWLAKEKEKKKKRKYTK